MKEEALLVRIEFKVEEKKYFYSYLKLEGGTDNTHFEK
jgi:hypothetical protein